MLNSTMGCIKSKTDINDRHPNIFQVTNVNDQGRAISPGKLEVTEIELVFYQRHKKPTKWPLRSLRKYGFDTGVFSFECGRRCPTGHGIYAFKCKKAEQLFNLVQQYIIGNVPDENDSTAVNTDIQLNRRTTLNLHSEGYLNPLTLNARSTNPISRPDSIGSNGALSPHNISPPDVCLEHNNNNEHGNLISPNNANADILDVTVLQQYANIANSDQTNGSSSNHVYMNVNTYFAKDKTKDTKEIPKSTSQIDSEAQHCYANIDTKCLENDCTLIDKQLANTPRTSAIADQTQELPINYITVREVNYAELDLNVSEKHNLLSQNMLPEIQVAENGKGYATIDFQKTTALSQSINPNMTVEEGSRKTRHNSTINYCNSFSD